MSTLLVDLSKLEVEALEIVASTQKQKQERNLVSITAIEGLIDSTTVFANGASYPALCCCAPCCCCCCCDDD